MHIVFFGDQHLESLGGAQVSMRLQRQFLEQAGHTVTVVAPKMHGARGAAGRSDPGYVDLPSVPITPDQEYSLSWPGRSSDRFLDQALASAPRVDIVHIQADFWGAFIGHRFAHRHGVPVVHTLHNRVDVGLAAVTPLHQPALAALNLWRQAAMKGIGPRITGNDGWAYLRGIAAPAHAVTAPSGHFAARLEKHGVAAHVSVIWNGIDDSLVDSTRAAVAAESQQEEGRRPRFVWLGRMSPEKRLLPFLKAVVQSGVDADIEIIGGGGQRSAAEKLVSGMDSVTFSGRLSYPQVLERIAFADAVVQTSIGFETQGMTPFEAATLGTPTIVSDPDIAGELRGGLWAVPDVGTDESARIAALAATLRTAAADVRAGVAPVPDAAVAEAFRQSSRTKAMVELYDRVLAEVRH